MIVLTLARRPVEGTVAGNALCYGTGGLDIDACRLYVPGGSPTIQRRQTALRTGSVPYKGRTAQESQFDGRIERRGDPKTFLAERPSERLGRWPANLLLEHVSGCQFLGLKEVRPLEGHRPNPVQQQSDGTLQFTRKPAGYQKTSYTNSDGLEEAPAWDCPLSCPVADLDRQSGTTVTHSGKALGSKAGAKSIYGSSMSGGYDNLPGDSGGASRFFKQIKGDLP